MVHYPNPRYIKKSHLRGVRPFTFSAIEKRADHVAPVATCTRCAQNVAKQKKMCEKSEHRRCEHCAAGNRGGCTLVPTEMIGRLNRLYRLRTQYDTAVNNAVTPKSDAGVISAGVKLARCQRQFNLELANRRRVAAHSGTPLGVPTQVPTTSPQYLSLILVEQRRMAAALEQLVGHAARMGAGAGAGDDSDSDSDSDASLPPPGSEEPDEGNQSAGGASGGEEGEEGLGEGEGGDD